MLLFIRWLIIILCLLILNISELYSQVVLKEEVKKISKELINSRDVSASVLRIDTILNEKDKIIGFFVTLNPKGFIITSSSNSIEPIIAYSVSNKLSFTEFKESEAYRFFELDLINRKIQSSKLKSTFNYWDDFIIQNRNLKKDNLETFGPLLETHWSQGGHFNDYCPQDPESNILKSRSDVGCTATSAAQILNYWKFPKKMEFSNILRKHGGDRYESEGKNGTIIIPDDAAKYNFPTFDELNSSLVDIKYDGNNDEEALICFGAGVKLGMNYSCDGSGVHLSASFFTNLGYGAANISSWSNNTKHVVINNIKNGWPVHAHLGKEDKLEPGHAVVIDGYKTSGEFHVNMGWGLGFIYDIWYMPPQIREYENILLVINNICPTKGWSQYASDEKNSRRTLYAIPYENTKKWEMITCNPNYSFNGLIVGEKEQIIISCIPKSKNQGYNPYILFCDKEGNKKDSVILTNEESNLSHPAQNTNGDVYVASAKGIIYKINQKTKNTEVLFTHSVEDELFEEIKVDKEGFIYFSFPSAAYCINNYGTQIWKKDAPLNCTFVRSPAVDVENNRVFVSFYSDDEKRSHFLTLNRSNGTVLNNRIFNDIPSLSRTIGTPSVSEDGNVYFGYRTKLIEVKPDDNYTFTEIYDSNIGLILQAPAIAKDGVVYINCWISETEQAVQCINPNNETVIWQKSHTLSDYDNIRDIYIDNNNTVLYTIQYENDGIEQGQNYPDTYKLLAIQDDRSNNPPELWAYDLNVKGGYSALGPNSKVYVSNGKYLSAILTDEFDSHPTYTNNIPPNVPTYIFPPNRSEDIDTSLTIRWSCTEPQQQQLTYDFYIGLASNIMTLYKSDNESLEIKISGLMQDSIYIWKVVAKDGQAKTEGEVFRFKVKKYNTPPNKPIIVSPILDLGLIAPLNLKWTCSDEEDGKNINYKVYKGASKLNLTQWFSTTDTIKNIHELEEGIFYWKVDAIDKEGEITSSDILNFTVINDDQFNIALTENGGNAVAISEGVYNSVTHYSYMSNDGDNSTTWTSNWSMPAWLEIEFDKIYKLDSVGVVWGAHNQKFSISLSEDGQNWTEVVQETWSNTNAEYIDATYCGSDIVYQSFDISPMNAKYMKIDVVESSAPSSHIFKAQIHEFKAFGTEVTGINDMIPFPNFKIYPNPATGTLIIDTDVDIKYIRIYSLQGSLLYENSFKKEVDISNFDEGVYLLKLYSKKREILKTEKIVVEK